MPNWIPTASRYYEKYTRGLSHIQDAFLLLIRLYWGWGFMKAGWGKLTNVEATAQFFDSIGMFWPTFNALVSGSAEFFGGLLLLLGLGSRVVTLVMIVNLLVAYVTAHPREALALFSRPNEFVTAPPFHFMLASVIVLLFGPGLISVDTCLRRYLIRRGGVAAEPAATPVVPAVAAGERLMTRRHVAQLTLAAVGGLIAGALLRGLGERRATPNAGGESDLAGPATGADAAAIQEIDAQAPSGIQPSLLLQEPHVCRGLNTCKGKDKGRGNSCAGQGVCATAESHVCSGQNTCKGQGGCGDYPGQNSCDGKGACAVPLKDETWVKARKAFEKLVALKGQKVGQAPSK